MSDKWPDDLSRSVSGDRGQRPVEAAIKQQRTSPGIARGASL